MSSSVFQCTKCAAMWTRRTLLDDACPECKGEIKDVTDTAKGQEFLRIVSTPVELRSESLQHQNIYATGPSSLFASHARKS